MRYPNVAPFLFGFPHRSSTTPRAARPALDVLHRHAWRPHHQHHTYTITARSTDPAGNTGTTTRTFVYDTTAPTVTNVSSSTANGAYQAGQAVTITITFNENVVVTGSPHARAELRRLGQLQRRLRRHDAQLHLQHRRRREQRRPRLLGHQLARTRRRHDQGHRDQQRDPHPARGRRRLEHRRPEEHRRRHHHPDDERHDPGQRHLRYNAATSGHHHRSSARHRRSAPSRRCRSRSRTAPPTTGAAPPSTRPHLLQRHRRQHRRLDYGHRHPRRPAHRRPHLHDHRHADRPGRQRRHQPRRTLRLRHHRADRDERHLDEGRTAPTRSGTLIPVTVTFSENVTVTGTPTLALNTGGTRHLQLRHRAARRSPSTTPPAPARTPPTSTTRPRTRSRSPAARSRTPRRTTRP